LAQNRKTDHQNRLQKAIDSKGKKLNDITNAEKELSNEKEQSDVTKIENISLQDQVNFSIVKLEIYQGESIKQERLANNRNKSDYQTNIGIQILDALKNGWYILKEIIIFIFNIWPFFLISGISFIVYKKYLRK
jgi:hypothetical protein